ncbi:UNVERIFIED_CONTAM: hypothetical protein GTU68_002436 [Idotea baltica]|nr:hypothetical protein [Idotea baltica]
MSFLLN